MRENPLIFDTGVDGQMMYSFSIHIFTNKDVLLESGMSFGFHALLIGLLSRLRMHV